MRKIMTVILTIVLILGLGCACAEQAQDNFLVSDLKLLDAL